jgi:hypothetical protein
MMNRIAMTIAFNMSKPICRDVLKESRFNDATNFGEGQLHHEYSVQKGAA